MTDVYVFPDPRVFLFRPWPNTGQNKAVLRIWNRASLIFLTEDATHRTTPAKPLLWQPASIID
jgi:hypothetical protein